MALPYCLSPDSDSAQQGLFDSEEHGWSVYSWKANGGYGNQGESRGRDNANRERIWFSPLRLDTPERRGYDCSAPAKADRSFTMSRSIRSIQSSKVATHPTCGTLRGGPGIVVPSGVLPAARLLPSWRGPGCMFLWR